MVCSLFVAEMKSRDISSGEVSSISSDNEELPRKVLCMIGALFGNSNLS